MKKKLFSFVLAGAMVFTVVTPVLADEAGTDPSELPAEVDEMAAEETGDSKPLANEGSTAFAIYSADDKSLTFYVDENVPDGGGGLQWEDRNGCVCRF